MNVENKTVRAFEADIAVAIGLDDAVMLEQIRYWVERNAKEGKNFHDGRYWTYNTFDQWHEQCPWFSVRSLKRIFARLEQRGLIITGRYNKKNYDQTRWYTIDYEKLGEITDSPIVPNWHDGECQNGTMDSAEIARPIPKITNEYQHTQGQSRKEEIDQRAYDGVLWLEEQIRSRIPDRPPLSEEQIESGARALQDLHDQNHTWKQLSDVCSWVQGNSFWRSRILNFEAFRKHFAPIQAQYVEEMNSA